MPKSNRFLVDEILTSFTVLIKTRVNIFVTITLS